MEIDWKLLREQKESLVGLISRMAGTIPEGDIMITQQDFDHMMGILHLIDSIQDDAVDCGKVDEKTVFS